MDIYDKVVVDAVVKIADALGTGYQASEDLLRKQWREEKLKYDKFWVGSNAYPTQSYSMPSYWTMADTVIRNNIRLVDADYRERAKKSVDRRRTLIERQERVWEYDGPPIPQSIKPTMI